MQRKPIFLACIFVCANCLAQLPESRGQYPFVHYTPREGLVNNRARSIFQDSKGKLYIATFGGLSIYDGTRFINYNTNNGLAVDLVNDVVEMGEDSIWVMPNDNHVQCIVKGRLKNFNSSDNFIPLINQLIKCSNGYYYAIADEGLFRLENRRFIELPFTGLPGVDSQKTLLEAVEVDKKLYILSNPGYKLPGANLVVYDLQENRVLAYKNDFLGAHLFNVSPGEIWVSTLQGLFMLDKISYKGQPLTLKPLPDRYHIPKDLLPHFMYRDRQNNIWAADSKGVHEINTDGDKNVFTIDNGLTTNFQTSIFQDYENDMWFTNDQTGLSKLSNQQLAFYPVLKPGYTASDFFIQPFSDSFWTYDGYHGKVLLILPNGRTEEFEHKESAIKLARSVSTNNQFLLSGTKIFRLNANTKTNSYSLTLYYSDSSNTMGFTSGICDKNGNLITVSNKLVVLTPNKILSEPIHYMADQVTIDHDNRIWTASRSNELFCFEVSGSGNNTKLSLLRDFLKPIVGSPRSITADQAGNIWIGTRDQGLYFLHFDGLNIKSTKQLTRVNGLSANFINYLYCDKDDNIWACTPSGLDKIKIQNNNFLVENITRSNDFYFPIIKIGQTGRGLFWILSSAGILAYNPTRLPLNNWKPQLSFSNVLISNAGEVQLFPGQELLHDQNNLSFQLSAPTYIDEKQTRFSYLLEGSGNKNWSTPSTDASINFVNLPPGEYKLRAKATFLHGLYPTIESSYSFTIRPAWWQTWWFKSLLGVLILGVALLGLRFYINRKLELQRAELEKRRAIEKERTRIATDMHDDLGAGLSQIKFLSETIGMRKQKHLPIEEEIESIRTFSHEMIDKMGEIVWALNEKNDTLSDLLSYTRSYAVEYLEQNGISCRVKEPENLPQDYVSSEFRRNIYLTVKETLHNIVKHAQATEVIMNIDITNFLSIQIKDNGIGIGEAPGRAPGNGLINMKTRIQGLKGRFEIVNNNGTQVHIFVPLNT
jgi:signal transduction histidine kinase/ligand-binding sensor domain-containing protein